MDPLNNPLTTCPIQTGCEMCFKPYPNWWFRCFDDPDRQFGNGSVPTRTGTWSPCLEPLLTLIQIHWISLSKSIISLYSQSTSFGLITKYSIHEICINMYSFSTLSPIYHISSNYCTIVQNDWFSVSILAKTYAKYQTIGISEIRDREETVCIGVYILCIQY